MALNPTTIWTPMIAIVSAVNVHGSAFNQMTK
jgi:hypothetical protein